MESLRYAFEGKGLLFTDDHTDFHFNDKMDHPLESVLPNSTITLNSLMGFTTRFSTAANGNANDELLAPIEPTGSQFSPLSPPEAPVLAKRARIANLQPLVPTCIVHGCNKDLSSSKDYYKRHKVCDVHSKTAVVVVNGIQQRFCQQCSRFHMLFEFDEGKRSCRKRLAGHNQRRRKPQFNPHLGSTYFTMNAATTSLLFSGLLPRGFLSLKYDKPSCLKLEDDPSQISQLALPMIYGPKSIHHVGTPLSVPVLYQDPNTSSCALSLLSPPPHNSSSTPHPPITAQLQNLTGPWEISTSQSLSFTPSVMVDKGVPPGVSSEGVNTVDLLELSLHLQRVEQQKYYTGIKPETGILLPEL